MKHEPAATLRVIGPIAGGVLLAIVALALHPHVGGRADPRSELRALDVLGMRDRLVHGTLLILLGTLLVGLTSYSLRRGIARRPVLAGMVCFALGIGGLFSAGLIDGFVLPVIVEQFVVAPPAVQAAAIATLTACGAAVNVFAEFGMLAVAVAIGAWSVDLVRDAGKVRTAGIVGFVSAALTVAVLTTGGRSLTPHELMIMLCAQTVWYGWIAVSVVPRR